MINRDRTAVAPAVSRTVDATFEPATVADDLQEVIRAYDRLFQTMDTAAWDREARRDPDEWTVHEAIAHLCALNGAGLECIKHTLRGMPYTFRGLDDRYALDSWNRSGIDDRLAIPREQLCAEFLRIHDEAADIARSLQPAQAHTAAVMPIYNRPVQIVEALSIIVMHSGLIHSAQVTEAADVSPLWTQFALETRHRLVDRVMRAASLLYRRDIGKSLRAALAFHIDGIDGGEWYVDLSPTATTSGEGVHPAPRLTLRFRETGDYFRMMTGRLNLPLALATRRLKLRGDLQLFLRMNRLFSVDASP